MPSRIRFTSARSVFEAFPDLSYVATRPANDIDPLNHARALLGSPRPSDAVLFISHLLPRREAVWWAAQCVRALLGAGATDEALGAAEVWCGRPRTTTLARRYRLRTILIGGSRRRGSPSPPAGRAVVSFPRIKSLLRRPPGPAQWRPTRRS